MGAGEILIKIMTGLQRKNPGRLRRNSNARRILTNISPAPFLWDKGNSADSDAKHGV